MAVASCNELPQGPGGITFNQRTYVRYWDVKAARTDSSHTVLTYASIPDYGDSYPDNTDAKADSITAELKNADADGTQWHVTVHYSTPTYSGGVAPCENPTDEDDYGLWGYTAEQVVVMRDAGGNPLLNSAGDPYDPPVMESKFFPTVTIHKNVASFDPTSYYEYVGAVNSSATTIDGVSCGVRTALVTDISATPRTRNGHSYVEVQIVVKVNPDTWDYYILDCGYYYRDNSDGSGSGSGSATGTTPATGGGNHRRILVDGEGCVEPQRLDGDGGILASGSASVFGRWRVKTEKDFSSLGLNI